MIPPDVNRDYAAALESLAAWYVHEAPAIRSPRGLVRETCRRLVAHGVGLQRFTAFMLMLHPDFFGVAHRWWRATDEVKSNQATHDIWTSNLMRTSPNRLIHEGAAAVRRRLTGPHAWLDFAVLDEYLAEGATDYVIMHLPFSDGGRHAVALSTDRADGFSLAELKLIDAMLPHIARQCEILTLRYLTTTLLDVYVGHRSGERVLTGQIRRGSGETIRAVIFMSDLTGFTPLTDRLPRERLIALLNDYFDCVGGPIEDSGGEILKFIGDAVLAIWPLDGGAPAEICRKALAAAHKARQGLAALREKHDQGGALDFGMALHVGDVMYGNIGTAKRLDFTVIGPAVNLAARLEGLTRALGAPLLLSPDFVNAADIAARSRGRHGVKGVNEPIEVFAPPS